MAPLYYAPCIVYGSTRFYLPPWLEFEATRAQQVDVFSPGASDGAVISNVRTNQATRIRLAVRDIPDTPSTAAILYWFEQLWQHLSGKTFKLFIFSDRAWDQCALESMTERIGMGPLTTLPETPISIISASSAPDTSLQLDFDPSYSAAYPYAHLVGRPDGDAWEPEELIPVTEPSLANHQGIFTGTPVVTTEGFEHRHVVGGTSGSAWRIKAVQITSAQKFSASGTTTVRIATAALGGVGGSNADASITSGNVFSAETDCDIAVTAGDTIYAYVVAAGNHSNVQYKFRLEAE